MNFDILIILTLITLGYLSGTWVEKRHYKSIRNREEKYLTKIPVLSLKNPDKIMEYKNIKKAYFVYGSVVLSIDYFKYTFAVIKFLFGGNISVYETLLDRARREAILRMIENSKGADVIINIKIETSSIYGRSNNNLGTVEVLAYGTAIKYEDNS